MARRSNRRGNEGFEGRRGESARILNESLTEAGFLASNRRAFQKGESLALLTREAF